MGRAGVRNFWRWFLLKQNMQEEPLPFSARALESYPGSVTSAQGTTQEIADEMGLIRRACAGDQDAFAILVQTHQRRAYVLAFRMLGNEDEAAEAVQEAFLAAWQGLHAFRGEARFSTWLYRIVYHACLRILEQRRRDSRDRDAATLQAQESARLEAGQEVQTILTDRERQRTIQQAIQQLPGKYRAVLILRHLQELTYEEIAQSLSLPVGTIKTHLFRARNLLKERLQLLDHEEPATSDIQTMPHSSESSESPRAPSYFSRLAPHLLHLGTARELGSEEQ
jgi:RNA polymerase sigma-70 factor (ECF subfamily)